VKDDFKPGDLNRRDTDRMRRYRELLDFYQGTQWPGRERMGEKRLTFNYARVVVDKMASYLMSGVKFVVDPARMLLPAEIRRVTRKPYCSRSTMRTVWSNWISRPK